ncbi:hypothetical protein ACK9YZ_05410 [Rhizobium sp. ZK1]|uniref:hypothetical protein n=1 Tax=Rhizobium sp. ZK1 TaxID=3389872 RepID=UPI0039F6CCB4
MTHEKRDVAKDFMDALYRLRAGVPLVIKLPKKGGPIPISISAVAREAQRSRTLIGTEDCAYPKVRKAVLRAMGREETDLQDEGESDAGPAETIDELKKDNRVLSRTVRELASRLAVSDDLVSQLREALGREEARSSGKRDSV